MASNGMTRAALGPRQERAIGALLAQPTVAQAADAAGVGEWTLYRWLSDAGFRRAYEDARRRAFREALGRLNGAAREAVEALREVLRDEAARPGERVAASRALLDFGLRATQEIEIEERLAQLERRAPEARSWR